LSLFITRPIVEAETLIPFRARRTTSFFLSPAEILGSELQDYINNRGRCLGLANMPGPAALFL